MTKMNRDVNELRDTYGAQGYIFADIQAQPRFLEEPGELDLVYSIDEGKQYRVDRIVVNIDGEYPHTRHSVVRNRISVNPGDIIDIREVRASERRLKASQLFEVDPVRGPTIAIRPRDASDGAFADRSGDTY
jgi:outer membrane protein insertion porin family